MTNDAVSEIEKSENTLPRSMGLALATSVVISNIIGVGIFTTSGLLARNLSDPLLLLGSWVFGGILALLGTLCYAELGTQFPRSGGEYVFLKEAYGALPSFLSGWSSLFAGFSAPIAAAAVGFTEYLSFYFPALKPQAPGGGLGHFLPGQWMAALIIVLFSALHYRKIKVGGSVHVGLTLLKVSIITIFIVCGFIFGRGSIARFAPAIPAGNWIHLTPTLASSLIFVMFSYSGWNAAGYIAGEIRNPGKNLPRSLTYGTLIVIILYLAINALYVYAIPMSEMSHGQGGSDAVIRVAEIASQKLFGLNASQFLNLIFMGTILGSISAMIIAGPRIYYAMAQDHLFPKALSKVHVNFRTPHNAIVLQAVWSIALVFTGRFEQLVTFSGVVMVFFSALTVAAIYVLRKKNGGARPAYSAWGYPWTPLAFLIASAWILIATFRSMPWESLAGFGVVASGIPFFFWWKKKNSK
jgi:basic amino acid/polyamine antiporter, APA family